MAAVNVRAQLDEAASSARAGNASAAEAALREILRVSPDEPNALRMLGVVLAQAGDLPNAIKHLQRALVAAPGFEQAARDLSTAWQRHADALFARGEADAARRAQRRSIERDPFFTRIRQAVQDAARGRAREAEAIYRDILKVDPNHVHALVALANVAIDRNAPHDAQRLIDRAMLVSPNMSHVHRASARLAMSRSQYPEAEAAAMRATQINPELAECWTTLGTVQAWGLHQREAVQSFGRALDIEPKAPRVLLSLGHVHKALGNTQHSVRAYRASIAAEATLGEAWWSLADLKTYRFGDAEVAAMQATLADPRLFGRDRAAVHFALGKAFEDRGLADESFEHYRQGNELRRSQGSFKVERFEHQCEKLRTTFRSASIVGDGRAAQPRGPRPIFVVGLPRSGSTLVDQILSSHSQVQGTMELPHVLGYVRELERRDDGYPDCVARMAGAELAALGRRYIAETASYRADAPYFVDKMPNNFLHVGLIAAMLPEAIFVDSRRHPLACCFSIYKQNFARGQVFGYGLDTLAAYYRSYVAMMSHWQSVLPGRVHRVVYERLVHDTEGETRRLLAHCGLPFEDACLRFFETDRVVRTASAEQVRQPIYRSAMAQWRRFEAHLAPLAADLGEVLTTWDEDESTLGDSPAPMA